MLRPTAKKVHPVPLHLLLFDEDNVHITTIKALSPFTYIESALNAYCMFPKKAICIMIKSTCLPETYNEGTTASQGAMI
jgi:hypothetical protein